MASIKNRYDFVYFFDVQDGNPNGDPDAGNLPRVDAETGCGLVTDVCLKRKVRNYVAIVRQGQNGYDIFVKEKAILNKLIEEAHEQDRVKTMKEEDKRVDEARRWMCERYYDIRTFGAVLSTGEKKAGQVRGPVQLTFARSVDPVVTLEHAITRMAVTSEEESQKQKGENRTMGRKYTVPYGLYRCYGFVSPYLAEQTGFSEDDLALLWEALRNMFEHDHSAARGFMNARRLVVFKHDSALGNAAAHDLFDLVSVKRLVEKGTPVRSFADYEISSLEDIKKGCPKGVEVWGF